MQVSQCSLRLLEHRFRDHITPFDRKVKVRGSRFQAAFMSLGLMRPFQPLIRITESSRRQTAWPICQKSALHSAKRLKNIARDPLAP